jgi:DNA-binding NtrC family response regulator
MTEIGTCTVEERGRHKLVLPGTRLLVIRGPDRGRALRLDKDELAVGTSPAAELRLTDPTVSRSHLTVRLTAEGWLLSDLGSTNGTFVGGRRVYACSLEPGDIIAIGATRLRLETVRQSVKLALSASSSFGPLIGGSIVARRLFATLETVAHEDVTVLLTGETGVGKDSCAEALHAESARAARPFVVVDCGAIPRALIESELFGHVKGAFTGAQTERIGAFEAADGGTLYLDHVSDMPRELQPKLLRAIERREIRRVGSAQPRRLDVRIIAATTRDLRVEVNRGTFREDLFYRLNVFAIRVPPLRERKADIPILAEHFRREATGDPDGALSDEVLQQLLDHNWPGNVRELRNRVEAIVLRRPGELPELEASRTSFREAKRRMVDEFERNFVGELLARSHGNVSEAARLAEMDRPYLIKLLRKHRIQP